MMEVNATPFFSLWGRTSPGYYCYIIVAANNNVNLMNLHIGRINCYAVESI